MKASARRRKPDLAERIYRRLICDDRDALVMTKRLYPSAKPEILKVIREEIARGQS